MSKVVWIINHYASPPSVPGGSRHFQLARYLCHHGWRAIIIASSVDHPSGTQRLDLGEDYRLENHDGVLVLRINTPAYSGNGSGRAKNMLAFAVQLLRKKVLGALDRPSLIIGSSVHPFAVLSAWWLSKRFGVPFVFEVRDLWPQSLIDIGKLAENSLLARALRLLESFLYKRADRIITLLPFAGDYIAQHGGSHDKVRWISNGVDLASFPEDYSESSLTHPRPWTLMYFGSHGEANGLDVLLDAVAILKPKVSHANLSVKLRLIGDGPVKSKLKEQAIRLGLTADDVVFEQAVPKAQIPELAKQADAFVITVLDLPDLYRYGISMNKLFDYMAAAKPIVIASAARNNPVADANAGIIVPPADPIALAEGIFALATAPIEERVRMGAAARAHVKAEYDYPILAERLAAELDAVLASAESEK